MKAKPEDLIPIHNLRTALAEFLSWIKREPYVSRVNIMDLVVMMNEIHSGENAKLFEPAVDALANMRAKSEPMMLTFMAAIFNAELVRIIKELEHPPEKRWK